IPVRSPMLKVAMISPFSPGPTTSFWVWVVVQPHDTLTDLKRTEVVPEFWYLKRATACLSPIAGCKSMVFCSHFNSARAATQSKIDNEQIRMRVFIFSNKSVQYNQPRHLAKSAEWHRSASYILCLRELNKRGDAQSSLPAPRRSEPDWRFGEGGSSR